MSTLITKRRHVGQRFGLIELIEKKELKGKTYLWLVRCNGCNKEYIRSSSFKKHTHSCGCQMKRKNNESPNWKGVGEISSAKFTHYKINAKKRGIIFDVSNEYLWSLFLSQNRKCAITGLPLVFGRSGRDENTASLDRIKSNLPYQNGNVQWVHKHINMMKLDHDQDYFIRLCALVSFNNNAI